MFRFTAWTSTLALLAAPVMADGHASTMGYALSGDGTSLMVMDSIATPDQVRSITLSTPVRSIAWRPVTRELVGFADGMIVTINPMTGETMDQSATFTDD